jgi:hypothetical protein
MVTGAFGAPFQKIGESPVTGRYPPGVDHTGVRPPFAGTRNLAEKGCI